MMFPKFCSIVPLCMLVLVTVHGSSHQSGLIIEFTPHAEEADPKKQPVAACSDEPIVVNMENNGDVPEDTCVLGKIPSMSDYVMPLSWSYMSDCSLKTTFFTDDCSGAQRVTYMAPAEAVKLWSGECAMYWSTDKWVSAKYKGLKENVMTCTTMTVLFTQHAEETDPKKMPASNCDGSIPWTMRKETTGELKEGKCLEGTIAPMDYYAMDFTAKYRDDCGLTVTFNSDGCSGTPRPTEFLPAEAAKFWNGECAIYWSSDKWVSAKAVGFPENVMTCSTMSLGFNPHAEETDPKKPPAANCDASTVIPLSFRKENVGDFKEGTCLEGSIATMDYYAMPVSFEHFDDCSMNITFFTGNCAGDKRLTNMIAAEAAKLWSGECAVYWSTDKWVSGKFENLPASSTLSCTPAVITTSNAFKQTSMMGLGVLALALAWV